MGRFTAVGDVQVELIVQRELELLVSALVPLAGQELVAILLVGGFGRGEGGVVRDGTRRRPMNDYDIVVVLRHADPDLTERIDRGLESAGMQRQLSVKQVDVTVTSATRLAIPVPTVARFEVKHGHQVLWGEFRGPIGALPAPWLPVHEGTKYYRSRAGGLLLARLLLDGRGRFDEPTRRELALLEINKALLVNGDAHLIRTRRYHHSYANRRERLSVDGRLGRLAPEIVQAYVRAIDERRELAGDEIAHRDCAAEWEQAATALLGGFLAFEGARFACRFATLGEYQMFLARRLSSTHGWHRLRARTWVREDLPDLATQRLAAMQLLLERLTRRTAGPGVAGWVERTASWLREWHPSGIVKRVVGQ